MTTFESVLFWIAFTACWVAAVLNLRQAVRLRRQTELMQSMNVAIELLLANLRDRYEPTDD